MSVVGSWRDIVWFFSDVWKCGWMGDTGSDGDTESDARKHWNYVGVWCAAQMEQNREKIKTFESKIETMRNQGALLQVDNYRKLFWG